ncbi:hypothetical protein HYALB_00012097 [Hymenoscyphus albidus]|uniref:Uncharacterized protein n=1 Tax=Hymenoscyphus albidus TaxID=595503 RepID=A0A9N9LGX2_9HELO|nr:hypothetical protein HYALB_00012097 [Hymenoscyphus albidus]
MSDRLAQAKVVWWNSSLMYDLCPHCETIHRHRFDGNYTTKKLRVSRCHRIDISGRYEIRFPFNEVSKEADYEIDTERALFVASGEDPTDYFLEIESDARLPRMIKAIKSRRRWSEAIEEDNKLVCEKRFAASQAGGGALHFPSFL